MYVANHSKQFRLEDFKKEISKLVATWNETHHMLRGRCHELAMRLFNRNETDFKIALAWMPALCYTNQLACA